MKKILLLLFSLIYSVSVFAQQDRIDTLFYTKDWKYAPNKAFADYYRIAYYPADSMKLKQYRDYYISGELQSSGNFITIDSMDDANTIFDGECVIYYKSGSPETSLMYNNGVLNGPFCVYSEDGRVKAKGENLNGKLSGVYTEYEGDVYMQIVYSEGVPINDYYIIGDSTGKITKFHISDNTPVWETASYEERDTYYADGIPWQYYNKNGVLIAVTHSVTRDYGKWHRIDIVVSNNSVMPIEFDPVVNIYAHSTNKNGDVAFLEVWSAEQYIKKVNRQQAWAAVAVGLAEGMAAASAGYSTSTTNSYYSGSAYAYGSGGYGYGSYSGSATSYTTSYNAAAAYQAQVLASQRMAEMGYAMETEKKVKELGYIKKNTIYPGETISGYVHIKRERGKSVYVIVNIEGAEYIYNWNYGK